MPAKDSTPNDNNENPNRPETPAIAHAHNLTSRTPLPAPEAAALAVRTPQPVIGRSFARPVASEPPVRREGRHHHEQTSVPTPTTRYRHTMKIAVVGTSGCGKSTFSRELARRTGLTHHELDALAWDDDWTMVTDHELRRRVNRVLERDHWIIDGNYGRAGTRDRVFADADAIAWLDLPRRIVWPRILQRSIRRACTKARLWGTNNRESFRRSFLSKDSVILWSITTFARRRRNFDALIKRDDTIATKFRRVTTRRAVRRLLDDLTTQAEPPRT